MSTHKLSIKDWPTYVARLGERAHAALQRGILSGALRCIPLMQKRTEQAVPASQSGRAGAFNTGNYRRRWKVRSVTNGAAIYNDATYAGVIDSGRRPGTMPNLGAIEAWAKRRLGLSDKEAKSAAYPIARAIKARGLKPRNVLSGATQQLAELIQKEVIRELQREMAK